MVPITRLCRLSSDPLPDRGRCFSMPFSRAISRCCKPVCAALTAFFKKLPKPVAATAGFEGGTAADDDGDGRSQ